jgi:hypothetical protein
MSSFQVFSKKLLQLLPLILFLISIVLFIFAARSDDRSTRQSVLLVMTGLFILSGAIIASFTASPRLKLLATAGFGSIMLGLAGFGLSTLLGQHGESATGAIFGLYSISLGTLACTISAFFSLVSRTPRDPLTCKICGYRLCGLPEPRCPECGTPF